QADLDLGPPVVARHEGEAIAAQVRVVVRRPLSEGAHDRRPDPAERGRAQPATRIARQATEDRAIPPLPGVAVEQELPPELLVVALRRGLRHDPILRYAASLDR